MVYYEDPKPIIISKRDWKREKMGYTYTLSIPEAGRIIYNAVDVDTDEELYVNSWIESEDARIFICKKPINIKLYCYYGYTLEESKERNNALQTIGITPKDIWLKKRKQEILDAIIRYTEAEIMIPMEWAKELRELEERGV